MLKGFVFALGAGAIFVWWSSGPLPDIVASNFVADGVANGFMPRRRYVALMVALTVAVPSVLVSIGRLASHLPTEFVNHPNRQFRLAPERRAAILASLTSFGAWSGYGCLAFLCLLHWFVVQANLRHPPRLEQPPLVGAASLLLLGLFCGLLVVLRRFFRVP
ncbi:MAG: hypothetical protein ABIV63_21580 [Caldimonas sp.]